MKRILILGSNGLLGSYLYRVGRSRGLEVVGISRTKSEFVDTAGDATDEKWLEAQLRDSKCDILINAAKFKGSTDECEGRRVDCWKVNFSLPALLASAQRRLGYMLVQISTDWVYEGKRGVVYNEASLPYPQNYYALSKFAAETAVSSAERYLILRTTGLFGLEKTPRNFLARLLDVLQNKKMFQAASDQYSQPISALELSSLIYELIEKETQNRVLITTGPEYLSRYQFARRAAAGFGYDEGFVSKVTSARRKIRIPRYLRTDNTEMQKLLGHDVKNVAEMINDLKKPLGNTQS
jgi:dTDP-4-dehydrorhamnose reductase